MPPSVPYTVGSPVAIVARPHVQQQSSSRIAICAYPPAFDDRVGGVPVRILLTFDMKKARMIWLHDSEKNFEDTITPLDRIHERNRQADRLTDTQTPHDGIDRTCIV